MNIAEKKAHGENVRRFIRLMHPSYVLTTRQLAARLGMTESAVEYHMARVRREDAARDRKLKLLRA